MTVTHCEPGPERINVHFDVTSCIKKAFAVEAHYGRLPNGDLGFISTGISYDDYRRMSNNKARGVGFERRLATPEWVQNEKLFREVLERFLIKRAMGGRSKPLTGTNAERMAEVFTRLKLKAEKDLIKMDEFCGEYMVTYDHARRKILMRLVEERDASIRLSREPWIIASCVRLYYFQRLNSTQIAEQFCLRSPHIRQILLRLNRLAEVIKAEKNAAHQVL